MNDEEIEQLIADLRELLFSKGFGWAAVEAEDSLNPIVAPRTRALALITAAEVATVDLADVELAADGYFGGEGMSFKADDTERFDGEEALTSTDRKVLDIGSLPLSGPQRRGVLADLAATRKVFDVLRSRLDGLA